MVMTARAMSATHMAAAIPSRIYIQDARATPCLADGPVVALQEKRSVRRGPSRVSYRQSHFPLVHIQLFPL